MSAVPCLHCGETFEVDDASTGATVGCPHCRQSVVIPWDIGAPLAPPPKPFYFVSVRRAAQISLVLGIVSFVGCNHVMGSPFALLAISIGDHICRRAKRGDGMERDRRIALAGMVLGYLTLALYFLVIAVRKLS